MDELRARPVAVLAVGLTAALELASVVLSWGLEPKIDTLLYAAYSLTMVGAGALILTGHPRNAIGAVFCVVALVGALGADAAQGWALRGAVEGWPGVTAAELVAITSWLPGGFGLILTFLLFPDGRLPSRRWRPVLWAGGAGLCLALPAWALSPDRGRDLTAGTSPVAVDALPTNAMLAVGMALFIGSMLASGLALVLRLRRSSGVERQQLKWVAFAAVLCVVALPVSFALWYETALAPVLAAIALATLPVAACVAILRYRLYDIDVIVERTVVYAAVTMALAAAYVATTLVLGTTLGQGSRWVTAAATLVAALAFRPLRDRVQDSVDRHFHQARHEAVRGMTDFLEALRAGQAAPEELEEVLRELTGDPRLRLRLFLPESRMYVDMAGRAAGDNGVGARVEIERGGRPLGLVVRESPTPEQESLLQKVLEAGGLAFEIARLHVELRRQLEEVRASRARIVHAGTEERRRLERDLHDGAQQRLVSIGLALRHAQHELSTADTAGATKTLEDAVAEVKLAIDELRQLARGLPPAELDAGLAVAFRQLASRAPVTVQVRAPSERFDSGIEGAAYFIGCEGVTNAVKHARATTVLLSAGREDGRLVVTVADDGIGGAAPMEGSGLSGLADRVAALGGMMRIDSRPGAGTTLTAELPCES